MDNLLRDMINYVYDYFTFVTNIELFQGVKVGTLMLAVTSFAVVIRLIILPMFQTDSTLPGAKGR